MLHVLRGGEQFEILDHAGIPVGHVARQLLNNRSRALAPSIRNSVGNLRPLAESRAWKHLQAPSANKVSNVGHDPFGASLYELIVIQLVQILFKDRQLLSY